MKRSAWTSPFGLAFLVGSAAALIAGFFTGSGMRGGEMNMAVPTTNFSIENEVDENALVAANREPEQPPAPQPAPVQAQPAPEPQSQAPAPEVSADEPAAPSTTRDDAAVTDAPVASEPRPRRRRAPEPPPEDEPGDAPPGY